MSFTKSTSLKAKEVTREWYIVDADASTLGRVSTAVAIKLTGKHKTSYTPHIDGGDHVIVINTDKIRVTGTKLLDKKYYRHSQYPGSLKESTLQDRLAKDSTMVFSDAVRGMLPKNKLSKQRLARLKIYASSDHPHAPQNPKKLEIK